MRLEQTRQRYEELKQLGLKLDMSRGKPSPEQLALSTALLSQGIDDFLAADGTDTRNYGGVLGLPEARALFASLLDVDAAQVVVDGNSSLALMHDVVSFALLHGFPGQPRWHAQEPVSFLCPVPGYDRHFAICESLGIRMISVPLNERGPDLAVVAPLLAGDPSIKGMWCVPTYANPSGTVYDLEVVERLAALPSAAPDFRLFWDDAYRLHHLTERKHGGLNVLEACARAGHADRAFVFASTSKITLAGAGIAALASSPANVAWWQKHVSVRTIGPDKVNQLRHVRFLRDRAGVEALMERHRALLQPKFSAVEAQFAALLGDLPEVRWSRPEGGYFIDLVTPKGHAQKTVELAKQAGITLTAAGAPFPYGKDPEDRHIRIAPSFPSLKELELAAQGVALSLRLALAS